ncbi:MAG: hypothetical protein M0P58_11690 [Bacteroidales bacterium]|nr:hypothetical protein [Bacteroidales bacterium]
MSKLVRTLFWVSGSVFVLLILFIIGFFTIMTVMEYNPRQIMEPEIRGSGQALAPSQREYTIMTWNIGYAGMGRELDFFYDGGKNVIPEKSIFNKCLQGIKTCIRENDSVDFLFVQEVDIKAKRTHFTNELTALDQELPGFYYIFGKNYDCRFVPMPLYQPMGHVESGLTTFSRFHPDAVEMVPFGNVYPWPKNLFMLKRCFLIMKFKLGNDKELILINTHNSAFDSTGELRKNELQILGSFAREEYSRGNYVIAGGDWNSNPAGFQPGTVISGDLVTTVDLPVNQAVFPGWKFVFDPLHPSNRFADMPYKKGKTKTTLIDFFVVSPNIAVKEVKTLLTDFEYSDHQPVVMRMEIVK